MSKYSTLKPLYRLLGPRSHPTIIPPWKYSVSTYEISEGGNGSGRPSNALQSSGEQGVMSESGYIISLLNRNSSKHIWESLSASRTLTPNFFKGKSGTNGFDIVALKNFPLIQALPFVPSMSQEIAAWNHWSESFIPQSDNFFAIVPYDSLWPKRHTIRPSVGPVDPL